MAALRFAAAVVIALVLGGCLEENGVPIETAERAEALVAAALRDARDVRCRRSTDSTPGWDCTARSRGETWDCDVGSREFSGDVLLRQNKYTLFCDRPTRRRRSRR